jgi:hypothetical protein
VVDIGQDNPDLIVTVPSGKIYVQCKRPFAARSVNENVKRATSQLRRDLKGTTDTVGVIALSLSRTLAQRGEFRIASHEAGLPFLAREAQLQVKEHEQSWLNVAERMVVGVLFHMLYPVVVIETASIMAAQFIVHGRIPGRQSVVFDELVEFMPE